MGRFKFRRGLGVSMDALRKLFDLSGRVALITGGSRGLGLQIAEALGEFGATLVLTARKQDELDAAVGHLSGHGIAASASRGVQFWTKKSSRAASTSSPTRVRAC